MVLRVKQLGFREYVEVWEAMRAFTERRDDDTPDEAWLVEHPPVYTLGRNGDPAHILVYAGGGGAFCGRSGLQPATGSDGGLNLADIPVVKTDRGGQVTYHGPGQLVVYALFDLNRLGIGVRSLVTGLENAAISALAQYGIRACARSDAPGVYVDDRKIASLGLRIRKGCSYHGLSLNVDMDLRPFGGINPCGYAGLEVAQLADLGVGATPLEAAVPLLQAIVAEFGFKGVEAG